MHEWAVMSLLVYLKLFLYNNMDYCCRSKCKQAPHVQCVIHFGMFLKITCSTLLKKVFHKCSCLIAAERYICNRITTIVTIEYVVKTTNKAMADWICRDIQTIYSHLAHNHPFLVSWVCGVPISHLELVILDQPIPVFKGCHGPAFFERITVGQVLIAQFNYCVCLFLAAVTLQI